LPFAASLFWATPVVTRQAQATFLDYRTTVPAGWVAAGESGAVEE